MADPQALFERAAALFHGRQFDAAAAVCEQLVPLAPHDPRFRKLAAVVEMRRDAPARALAHLQAALTAVPTDPGLRLNLGAALRASGQLEAAVEAFTEVTRQAPRHHAAWFNLANAFAALEQFDDAVAAYRRCLAVDPHQVSAAFNLGSLLLQRGDPEGAIEALGQLVAQKPDSAEGQGLLGAALRQSGRMDAAIDALRRAVELQPGNATAHAALANAMGETGDLAAAVAVYEAAIAVDAGDATIWSNYAWTLNELGRCDDAAKAVDRAIALRPDLAAGHYHLALIRQRQGRLEAAEAALRAAIAAEPAHVRAHATLGMVLDALSREDEANRIFDADRLLLARRIDDLAPVGDVADFNAQLASFVHGHRTLMFDRPNRATRHGARTLDLAGETDEVVQHFRRAVDAGVEEYLAMRRADGGGCDYFRDPPARWEVAIWAVVLKEGGYQAPHNHPSGFLSGVYYVNLSETVGQGDNNTAGWIAFGPSNQKDDGEQEMITRRTALIRPEAGKMLFFPSYFWHRTLPFTGDEERIFVAFDVLAR